MTSMAIDVEERSFAPGDSHLVFDGGLGEKEIAITFGGSIDPVVTPKILDLLLTSGLRAHFFVTGLSAKKNLEIIERINNEGHVLGSYGYGQSATPNAGLSFEERSQKIEEDITLGHEVVYASDAKIYPFVRLSVKTSSVEARHFVRNNNVYAFYWNIDYEDENPAESITLSLKREGYRGLAALGLGSPYALVALKQLITEIQANDMKVIVLQPPEGTDWKTRLPLIREQVKQLVSEKGSFLVLKRKANNSI